MPRPVAPPSPAGERQVARELLVLLAEGRPRFLDFLRRRVRSGADADDLFQQALLRAAERLDSLRDEERVEAWFFRILRHTLADHHATWATRGARLDLLGAEASESGPEQVALCACSLGVLDQLSPVYQEVVRRVDLDEQPLAAVAASLGISTGNATVRLHRARRALRTALLARCGTTSVRACQGCACEEPGTGA